MRLPHRLNLQLPLPPLRRHQVDGAPSLVQLRLKCGSGGVFLAVCDSAAVGAGNGSGHSRVISAVAIE